MYVIQHRFICRTSDSTVSDDTGIEPRPVAILPLTARLDLIHEVNGKSCIMIPTLFVCQASYADIARHAAALYTQQAGQQQHAVYREHLQYRYADTLHTNSSVMCVLGTSDFWNQYEKTDFLIPHLT